MVQPAVCQVKEGMDASESPGIAVKGVGGKVKVEGRKERGLWAKGDET